jgi:hypothetical protein
VRWVYALPHKGNTTSDITYNEADPPEAYNNPMIEPRLVWYNTTAREIHGPEFDLRRGPLDGEVIMRIGKGKKHGHYFVGDSILDQADVPSLPTVKARSTTSAPPIQRRLNIAETLLETVNVI